MAALPLSRCAQMETVKATVSLEHVLEQAMESVGEMGKAISSVQTVTSEVDSLCDMEMRNEGFCWFKVSVNGGMKFVVESDMTDKLLMRQMLKFDGMRQKGKLEYIERFGQ
ncbi:hypothetical protein Bca52824_035449 [Brassica carinata]|uniref:Uncharacterized protein n=1 Tax=Brassica carinata TaxID=52824 RepID=A0A8X7S3F9_BRACI|nr:hypothetical protein Bca52824_035449 [Brassica carinata]